MMLRMSGRQRAADAVDARMGDLDLNQQQLAEKAGVDTKTVGDLIRGTRWPIARTRARIERALGWPPGELQRIRSRENEGPQIPPDLQRKIDALSPEERDWVIDRLTRRRSADDAAGQAPA